MALNWTQIEREEADIDQREDDGLITREQANKERRDLHYDVQGAYEEDLDRARAEVDRDWGRW